MMRVQAARLAGHGLRVTVRKTTISVPPAVSRYAATEIAERPAARLSRLPVRPPVPHSNPDSTRHRRPVPGRRRAAAADTTVDTDMKDRSCDEKGKVAEAGRTTHPHRKARQLTRLGAPGL